MKLKKIDRELVVFVGTDIPPMSTREMMLWGIIQELIEKNKSPILTMNQIFRDFTFSKKERFNALSRLIKNNVIRKIKHPNGDLEFISIPKNTFNDMKEDILIYKNLSKKDKYEVKREFMK